MDLLICARMGSSRLPGKALMEIGDEKCSLEIIHEKVNAVIPNVRTILATTSDPKDNALAEWAENKGMLVFRGSENDVLGRIYAAVNYFQSEEIMEILGDNPLIPRELIAKCSTEYLKLQGNTKYLASSSVEYNFHEVGKVFPIGLRVQVFNKNFIDKINELAKSSSEREHATSYIYSRPQFCDLKLVSPDDLYDDDVANFNFAINTKEQLDTARDVYKRFGIECSVDNLVNWIKNR